MASKEKEIKEGTPLHLPGMERQPSVTSTHLENLNAADGTRQLLKLLTTRGDLSFFVEQMQMGGSELTVEQILSAVAQDIEAQGLHDTTSIDHTRTPSRTLRTRLRSATTQAEQAGIGPEAYGGLIGAEVHRAYFDQPDPVLQHVDVQVKTETSHKEGDVLQLIESPLLFPDFPHVLAQFPEIISGRAIPEEIRANYQELIDLINSMTNGSDRDALIKSFFYDMLTDLRAYTNTLWEDIHEALAVNNLMLAYQLAESMLRSLEPWADRYSTRLLERRPDYGLLIPAALIMQTAIECRPPSPKDATYPIIMREIRAVREIESTRVDGVRLMAIDDDDPTRKEVEIILGILQTDPKPRSIPEAMRKASQALQAFRGSAALPVISIEIVDLKSAIGDDPDSKAHATDLGVIQAGPMHKHVEQIERYCAYATVAGEEEASFRVTSYRIIYIHPDFHETIEHFRPFTDEDLHRILGTIAGRIDTLVRRGQVRHSRNLLERLLQGDVSPHRRQHLPHMKTPSPVDVALYAHRNTTTESSKRLRQRARRGNTKTES